MLLDFMVVSFWPNFEKIDGECSGTHTTFKMTSKQKSHAFD